MRYCKKLETLKEEYFIVERYVFKTVEDYKNYIADPDSFSLDPKNWKAIFNRVYGFALAKSCLKTTMEINKFNVGLSIAQGNLKSFNAIYRIVRVKTTSNFSVFGTKFYIP